MKIPRSHPRYGSLVTRERLVEAWKGGIGVPERLIAHGRGEAFDYLLGEETSAPALVAEKAAAAFLLGAKRPAISVNGHVAALAAKEVGRLARGAPARRAAGGAPRPERGEPLPPDRAPGRADGPAPAERGRLARTRPEARGPNPPPRVE